MWFLEMLSASAEVICNEIYRITPKIGIDFPAARTSSLHSITDGRQQSPPGNRGVSLAGRLTVPA
ncbi:hypothetical protein [Rhizobium rhizogenes]|uniref:hypothetical protein n=1 Tax=Rhizobium rhizogenes TaxID=359 RepID=UPI001574BD0F|nr:hypothetical protein [Rhizobium rhizogenes]NTF66450.1 hypothetical protein [Rhizobium rhizogenes]